MDDIDETIFHSDDLKRFTLHSSYVESIIQIVRTIANDITTTLQDHGIVLTNTTVLDIIVEILCMEKLPFIRVCGLTTFYKKTIQSVNTHQECFTTNIVTLDLKPYAPLTWLITDSTDVYGMSVVMVHDKHHKTYCFIPCWKVPSEYIKCITSILKAFNVHVLYTCIANVDIIDGKLIEHPPSNGSQSNQLNKFRLKPLKIPQTYSGPVLHSYLKQTLSKVTISHTTNVPIGTFFQHTVDQCKKYILKLCSNEPFIINLETITFEQLDALNLAEDLTGKKATIADNTYILNMLLNLNPQALHIHVANMSITECLGILGFIYTPSINAGLLVHYASAKPCVDAILLKVSQQSIGIRRHILWNTIPNTNVVNTIATERGKVLKPRNADNTNIAIKPTKYNIKQHNLQAIIAQFNAETDDDPAESVLNTSKPIKLLKQKKKIKNQVLPSTSIEMYGDPFATSCPIVKKKSRPMVFSDSDDSIDDIY